MAHSVTVVWRREETEVISCCFVTSHEYYTYLELRLACQTLRLNSVLPDIKRIHMLTCHRITYSGNNTPVISVVIYYQR